MRPPTLTAAKKPQRQSPELRAASKLTDNDPRRSIAGHDAQARAYAADGAIDQARRPGGGADAAVDGYYAFGSVDELCASMGRIIDLAAPAPGVRTAFSTTLVVKLGGVGYVELKLDTAAAATEAGRSLSGSVALTGGVRADTEWFNAYLGLKGTVGFVAKGDSGVECMELLMLAIDQHIRSRGVEVDPAVIERLAKARSRSEREAVFKAHEEELRAYFAGKVSLGVLPRIGDWVADLLFGVGYADGVLKGMDDASTGDEADSVKTYAKLGVAAGGGIAAFGDEVKGRGELDLVGREATLSASGGRLKRESKATGVGLRGAVSGKRADGRGFEVDASGAGLGVTVTLPAGKGGEAWKTTVVETLVARARSSLRGLLGEELEPALARFGAEVNRCGVTSLAHAFGATASVVVKVTFGGDATTLSVSSSTAWSKKSGDLVAGTPYFALKGAQTREIASFALPGVRRLLGR